MTDPTSHWVTALWTNVTRAPYKDLMHGQKKVFAATRRHSHELHREFTSMVRDCCMLGDVKSQSIFDYYRKKETGELSLNPLAGISMMMQSKI